MKIIIGVTALLLILSGAGLIFHKKPQSTSPHLTVATVANKVIAPASVVTKNTDQVSTSLPQTTKPSTPAPPVVKIPIKAQAEITPEPVNPSVEPDICPTLEGQEQSATANEITENNQLKGEMMAEMKTNPADATIKYNQIEDNYTQLKALYTSLIPQLQQNNCELVMSGPMAAGVNPF